MSVNGISRDIADSVFRGRESETPSAGARISRRAFLGAMGAAAASAVLTSCGLKPGVPASRADSAVQLVYQDWRTEWFPGMAKQMLERFHEAHKNITVFFAQDPDNLSEKMLPIFQAGTAPDVLAGCCDHFPTWAQHGYLLDLRPFVEADLARATIDDWDQAQYRALFTRDGTQFALPKYHGALALFYNKDIFDKYGVDYPDRSWDHGDYHEAMIRFLRDIDHDGRIDVWGSMIDIGWERLQVHVNAWGGHFVDPGDPTRSLMAEPPALQAMQWVRDRMWDDHTMATPMDIENVPVRQAFIDGRLAMMEEGSWALKDILEHADFRLGVTTFPAGPVRRATLATTDGFAIYAGTKYPEASWELLKFLISPDYGRAMAHTHLLQPARASLLPDWTGFIEQEYTAKVKDFDLGVFADGHLNGYSVTAEIFANMSDARRLAEAAWSEIFTLGQVPVDRMKNVSAQIQEVQ